MLEIPIAEGKNPVGTTAANTNPITIGGVDSDNKIVGLVLNADGSITAKMGAGTEIAGKFIPVDADGDEKFTAANPASVQLTGRTTTKTVTISSGTSLSTEVDLEGYQLCAIEMPSAWDAAALTFQGSSTSSGTYKDIKANGLEVTEPGSNLTATAGVINAIDVNAMALAPIRYLKIRSGTSGSAVNQTANRTLTLILKV